MHLIYSENSPFVFTFYMAYFALQCAKLLENFCVQQSVGHHCSTGPLKPPDVSVVKTLQ